MCGRCHKCRVLLEFELLFSSLLRVVVVFNAASLSLQPTRVFLESSLVITPRRSPTASKTQCNIRISYFFAIKVHYLSGKTLIAKQITPK